MQPLTSDDSGLLLNGIGVDVPVHVELDPCAEFDGADTPALLDAKGYLPRRLSSAGWGFCGRVEQAGLYMGLSRKSERWIRLMQFKVNLSLGSYLSFNSSFNTKISCSLRSKMSLVKGLGRRIKSESMSPECVKPV